LATTLPATPEIGSPVQSSSDDYLIEMFLLDCGHGDTILLRLPGDRWCLIDCYLPQWDGTRQRFFDFVEEKRIKALDLVIQTHPDFDHYHGMAKVIAEFLSRGQKQLTYIDTGVNAHDARRLMQGRIGGKEYTKLQEQLSDWSKAGRVRLRELHADCPPISPLGFSGQIDFIPIGPEYQAKRGLIQRDLEKLYRNPKATLSANALSIVVALSVRFDGEYLNLLLAGDADVASLDRAISTWRGYCAARGRESKFHAVKVPHHGSIGSHSSELCRSIEPASGRETAAISSGTRSGLPDREVIRQYQLEGWKVMATTIRSEQPRRSNPLHLADRSGAVHTNSRRYTIRISWGPRPGLKSEPAESEIPESCLHLYDAKAARAHPLETRDVTE
jgi:beta-lactamase superfamily II metal-dependent hydrolase